MRPATGDMQLVLLAHEAEFHFKLYDRNIWKQHIATCCVRFDHLAATCSTDALVQH